MQWDVEKKLVMVKWIRCERSVLDCAKVKTLVLTFALRPATVQFSLRLNNIQTNHITE